MGFSPLNNFFWFSAIFPIVIPIVIQKRGATLKNSSYFLGYLQGTLPKECLKQLEFGLAPPPRPLYGQCPNQTDFFMGKH